MSNTWNDLIKKQQNKWSCNICCLLNDPDTNVCAACQTSRFSGNNNAFSAPSNPFGNLFQPKPTKNESQLFQKLKNLNTEIIKAVKEMKNGETRIFCCGMGSFGSLGFGVDYEEPAKIFTIMPSSCKIQFKEVFCGSFSCAAIDYAGHIYTWGPNDGCCLGRDTSSDDSLEFEPCPVQIPDILYSKSQAIKVSVGDEHMVALLNNGEVYSWGSFKNERGRVGHHFENDNLIKIQKYPYKMTFGNNEKIIDISSGINHALVLNAKGVIYIFGISNLGMRTSSRFNTIKNQLKAYRLFSKPSNCHFVSIYSGSHSVYSIDNKSQLYSMGLNNFYQLGDPKRKRKFSEILSTVKIPNNEKVVDVSAGAHHALCRTISGKVYSWGRNASGCLGRKTSSGVKEFDNVVPEDIPDATPKIILDSCEKICSGHDHNLALVKKSLKGFGFASDYRIGNNSEQSIKAGEFATILTENDLKLFSIISMDAGSQSSAILIRKNRSNISFENMGNIKKKQKIE